MNEMDKLYARLEKLITNACSKNLKNFVVAGCYRRDGCFVVSTNGCPKTNQVASAHAEIRLLRKSPFPAEIFIARMSKTGRKLDSLPCSRCAKILFGRGVRHIVGRFGGEEVRVSLEDILV